MYHHSGGDIPHRRYLQTTAREAREAGKTFEEWAATIIDL
jgi:hypothetical protein